MSFLSAVTEIGTRPEVERIRVERVPTQDIFLLFLDGEEIGVLPSLSLAAGTTTVVDWEKKEVYDARTRNET